MVTMVALGMWGRRFSTSTRAGSTWSCSHPAPASAGAAPAGRERPESARERRRVPAGHDLRNLAARRVSDERDLAQVELLEDGFYIVGELLQTVGAAETGRLTPAPLGDH